MGVWTQLSPVHSPSARGYQSMAFYEGRSHVILFGGASNSATASGLSNETWKWDGTDWTQLAPTHSPSTRQFGGLAYDENTDTLILSGGYRLPGGLFADTWQWNGTDWTQLTPTHTPPKAPTLVYDKANGNIVAWDQDSVTWLWDGTDWLVQSPAHSPTGTGRADPYMSYQDVSSAVILFGGGQIGGSGLNTDTWKWDGADWTQLSPGSSPGAMLDGGFAYCPSCGRGILACGYNAPPNIGSYTLYNNTYAWDNSTWQVETTGPSARQSYPTNLVSNADGTTLLFFGGQTNSGGTTNAETWTFSCPAFTPQIIRRINRTRQRLMLNVQVSSMTQGFESGGTCLAWSPSLSLILAAGGSPATAPDGQTWTNHGTPFGANNGNSDCWSPDLGLYVVTSHAGSSQIWSSPDGATFTGHGILWAVADGGIGAQVIWSHELGLFIAVGVIFSAADAIFTSPDGVTWTGRGSPLSISGDGAVNTRVCWSPDLGIAVMAGQTVHQTFPPGPYKSAATSTDGITWTSIGDPFGQVGGATIAWSPTLGIFSAVSFATGGGNPNPGIFTSSDGTNWTQQGTISVGTGGQQVDQIIWSPENALFVAPCSNTTTGETAIFISSDGINFTSIGTPLVTHTGTFLSPIVWAKEIGRFCVTGEQSGSGRSATFTIS